MPDEKAHDGGNAPRQGAEDRSAALQAENEELRGRMLRALADAENTRRRADRTAQEARRYGIADFARELLPVADNLERTISAAEPRGSQQSGDAALLEGVAATQRILRHALERFGVRKIEALGAPFDPSVHEAMIEVADPSQPPGVVVDVMEDGFTIHDRLLRPARVAVAQRRQQAPDSPEAQTSRIEPRTHSRDGSP